jgi:hypothetical protein
MEVYKTILLNKKIGVYKTILLNKKEYEIIIFKYEYDIILGGMSIDDNGAI